MKKIHYSTKVYTLFAAIYLAPQLHTPIAWFMGAAFIMLALITLIPDKQ